MGTQQDSSARIDAQERSELLEQAKNAVETFVPHTTFLPSTVHVDKVQNLKVNSVAQGTLKTVRGWGTPPMEAAFSFVLSVRASQQIKEIVRQEAERYIKAIQATQATDPHLQEDR